jgi:tRNA nucleotidyltransferase (CCA-adding enzyme)
VRRTIARIGPAGLPALWALRRADLRARGKLVEEGLANQVAAEERFQREIDRAGALKIADLAIGGEDVMRELRLAPGRRVGQVLTKVLDRVIDDPQLNSKERLIELLPGVLEELSTGISQESPPSGKGRGQGGDGTIPD